jgi:hypothetical protein
MEPQWTKQISSNAICSTYYIIFWLYVAVSVLAILGTAGILMMAKLPRGLSIGLGFQGLLSALIAATLALFQYLVCSRALLADERVVVKKEGFSQSLFPLGPQ